jgi:FkbM family methyltransferase
MSTPAPGIIHLVRAMNIQKVLDVGANIGQFGRALLDQGYEGELISFEPLAESFAELSAASANHPNWHCRQLALGVEDGEATLNISANRVSSSILPALPWSIEEHGPIAFVGQETVEIRRLDTLWHELPFQGPPGPLMLKIDVQGFEPRVLAGLGERLGDIDLLLFEASLIPVYEGETAFEDLVSDMRNRGMYPVWIGAGWGSATTGQIFQCDIAFAQQPLVRAST